MKEREAQVEALNPYTWQGLLGGVLFMAFMVALLWIGGA